MIRAVNSGCFISVFVFLRHITGAGTSIQCTSFTVDKFLDWSKYLEHIYSNMHHGQNNQHSNIDWKPRIRDIQIHIVYINSQKQVLNNPKVYMINTQK